MMGSYYNNGFFNKGRFMFLSLVILPSCVRAQTDETPAPVTPSSFGQNSVGGQNSFWGTYQEFWRQTAEPTTPPSISPAPTISNAPTAAPSDAPTTSPAPTTEAPTTAAPTTAAPTTQAPTVSSAPSVSSAPTISPAPTTPAPTTPAPTTQAPTFSPTTQAPTISSAPTAYSLTGLLSSGRDVNMSNFKAVVCPRAGERVSSQTVDGYDPIRRYTEISGLVMSPTQVSPITGNPVMYVVNDGAEDNSSSLARIGVYDSETGDRLATLDIGPPESDPDMRSFDFEALAIGPCSPTGSGGASTCIYIADIGDNVARDTQGRRNDRTERNPYRILKIREPKARNLPYTVQRNDNTVPVELLDFLDFDYLHPESPTSIADSEAIFLDPVGWGGAVGDIYVITKWNEEDQAKTRLFQIPVQAWTSGTRSFSAIPVGDFTTNHDLRRRTWTGADSTFDGTVIALSDYYRTHLFLRCPGASVAEAIMGDSCHKFAHASPGQVETSAFSYDGTKHLEIPEGPRSNMGWTEFIYHTELANVTNVFGDIPAINQVCPLMEWYVEVHGTEGTETTTTTTCRTVLEKSERPKLWCWNSPNVVGLVMYPPNGEFGDVPMVDASRMKSPEAKAGTKLPSASSSPIATKSMHDDTTDKEDPSAFDDTLEDVDSSHGAVTGVLLPALVLILCSVMTLV